MTHTQYRDDHTSLIADRALAYDAKEKSAGYRLDVSYFEQTGRWRGSHISRGFAEVGLRISQRASRGKGFLTEIQERGKLNGGKVLDYAKGLFIQDYRGLHSVSHGGSWGGYPRIAAVSGTALFSGVLVQSGKREAIESRTSGCGRLFGEPDETQRCKQGNAGKA